MKKKALFILVTSLVSLLTSCSSSLEKETVPGEERVGITFTLSMNGVAPLSRSLSSSTITQYENTIVPDQFRILAYTPQGTVHDVTIFSMEQITESTYQISGELTGIYSIDKIVILANCNTNFNPSETSLSNLTYPYLKDNYNPKTPKKYIPMWGVTKISTPLHPGIHTHIGTINLLRAMAKIQVRMANGSQSELLEASITRYNNQGACVPGSFEDSEETAEVAETTIPPNAKMAEHLPFFQMDDKSYVIHLPEYQNNGNPNSADITVKIKDVNNAVHEKKIAFGKYHLGEFTNERWDILRNHFYEFNLLLEVAADGNLTLEVKTEKYAEFEVQPAYGD